MDIYGTYNYSFHGVYKPTFTSLGGAPQNVDPHEFHDHLAPK